MTDRRVSEDTALSGANVASGDLFDLVDVSDSTDAATGTNKKITASEVATAITLLGALATDAELASHEADTTSVHGISDTSALETTTGAQTKVDTHVNDATAAHAASAISADSTTLVGTGTDVQAVLEELDNGIADHLADSSAAHAASAISFSPTGTIASTDVQAAIAEVASEAGTGTSTPGVTAPYIGRWLVGTTYAAGDCVDHYDTGAWLLYQATTATTGDDPASGAPWEVVTSPVMLSGSGNPNTIHDSDPNGPMLSGAPDGTLYLTTDSSAFGECLFQYDVTGWASWMGVSGGNSIDTANNISYVFGVYEAQFDGDGDGSCYSQSGQAYRNGSGDGDASGTSVASRNGSGNGNASILNHAIVQGTATGTADARRKAQVLNTATGVAVSGDEASHHALSYAAKVLPRANSTEAYIEVESSFDFLELGSDPAAAAAAHLRLYAKDNGGVSRVYIRDDTAVKQLAVTTDFDAAGTTIPKSLVDAKGDLLVGTADNTVSRLAAGTNGYVLTADSAQTEGVKWAAASGSSLGGLNMAKTGLWLAPPFSSATFSTDAGWASALNKLCFVPFWPGRSLDIDRIGVRVSSAIASSTIRLGAYTANATTLQPDALIFDAGTVDTSGTGALAITITQTLPAFCWLAAVAQGGASPATIYVNGTAGIIQTGETDQSNGTEYSHEWFRETGTATSGALPSTAPAFGPVGARSPRITVRCA